MSIYKENIRQRSIALLAVVACVLPLWLGVFAQADAPEKDAAQKPTAPPQAKLTQEHQFFLEDHCYNCHDASQKKGKVNLEDLPLHITTLEQAELWQKVLNAINAGEMPPQDKKQPPQQAKADFLADLADTMVTARKVLSDAGGKITMRRLNRREYGNTIDQLLGVLVDENALPEEGGSGFDTVGASLFMSSDQLERYMKVGRSAIDEAFARRAAAGNEPKTFRIEPETVINRANDRQRKAMEAQHERFLEWKAGVDQVVATPENQARMVELRKQHPDLARQFNTRIYRYADLLEGTPDPKDYGFRDSQDVWFRAITVYNRLYPYLEHYADLPGSDRGTYLMPTWGTDRVALSPPAKQVPSGTYTLRVRAGVAQGVPDFRHFIEVGHPQRRNQLQRGFADLPLSAHQVTGTIDQPSIIETQIQIGDNMPRELAVRERQPTDDKALRDAFFAHKRANGYGHPPAIWIDWVELIGPLPETGPKAALQQILDRHDDKKTPEAQRSRAILSDFALIAFRHAKPEAAYIDRLVSLFETRRTAGEPFNLAIRTPLTVILASPGLLYLNEPGDEDAPRTLTDRELAVRLSYFLWSGPPDATLYELAAQNRLSRPGILRHQVDRMIADPRSDAFVAGFMHQWLDMQRLDFFQFDARLHREFDESTRAAAREEVYQSFAHLLRSKSTRQASLGHLLKSDYVIINGLLATYYGIDGVTGDAFRKVKLPADSPRGGLLGMAAISAMGSDGVNSSPVERGAWVLRHLLNDPPPPAPPNVPQISRLADQVLTTRERLAAHMQEAQCASCHRKIDPIGFGLENFDAAGKWRTTDRDGAGRQKKVWDIDASGTLHKGPAFNDYFGLRDVIASRQDDFARGLTQALIEYALGRPYGFTDAQLASEIVTTAKGRQYAIRAFVLALVQSEMFHTK